MINFELDEEQKMLTDAIGRLAQERMRKVFRDADEAGTLPADVVEAGWEMGVLPTSIPEEYGGFGDYSVITGVLATEAFAYGDLAMTLAIMAPNLVALPLMLAGTEAQKEAHLPLFCEESMPHVTAALTEPVIQFDPRKLKTTAVLDGEDYILNGTKSFVPLAENAETFLIYANEDDTTQAFFVPADAEGFAVLKREKLMGVLALPTFQVKLDNVRVSAVNKLGGNRGIDFGLILNHSRVALGAAAVGMAKGALDYAIDYTKQRVQFGEPVAHRQSIAFMLAEMAMDIDSARLLVWEAAWQMDQGKEATQAVTVMKYYIDDMVLTVCDRALQALGGYGYIREYPVELWLRNARAFASFDGMAIV